MAIKTALNAKNLEALGVQRLAELLIEISTGSAAAKRRLRLELAGQRGSDELAHEVRKRLGSIARSETFINWRRVKTVRADLETQRRTIIEVIAPDNPREAFELMWQFLGLGSSVLQRTSETGATLIEVFHQACRDAGSIAMRAAIDGDVLADRVFRGIQQNDVGQYDRLIEAMMPALGRPGIQSLQEMLIAWRDEPIEASPSERSQPVKRNRSVTTGVGDFATYRRQHTVQLALQEIADVEGNVDAYISQIPLETRSTQAAASDIARRLLKAGRPEEALAALDRADQHNNPASALEWQIVRLEVLEALGRGNEAQSSRWMYFEQSLQEVHLRAFLRRLADFDDVEAEDKAFRIAHAFPDVQRALAFFVAWPAFGEAARLIVARRQEFDGDDYELLSQASDALSAKYPVSATILLRTIIDDTLDRAKSSRYKHAARHLAECANLASRISDFGGLAPHDAYLSMLRERHGKKQGFWKHVRT